MFRSVTVKRTMLMEKIDNPDEIELKMKEEINGNTVFWLNGDEISFRHGH